MLKNLHISCIQTDLFWEDIDQNLKHFETKLTQIPEESKMVILPEMFTTGFSMNYKQLAEDM